VSTPPFSQRQVLGDKRVFPIKVTIFEMGLFIKSESPLGIIYGVPSHRFILNPKSRKFDSIYGPRTQKTG